MPDIDPFVLIFLIMSLMFFAGMVALLSLRLKNCSSDRVLVVSGMFTSPSGVRRLHGGRRLVLPFVQDYAYLSLEPMAVDLDLQHLATLDEPADVQCSAVVAIGAEPELMYAAATRLLRLSRSEIEDLTRAALEPVYKDVIATLSFDQLANNRGYVTQQLRPQVESALAPLGLVLISYDMKQLTSATA